MKRYVEMQWNESKLHRIVKNILNEMELYHGSGNDFNRFDHRRHTSEGAGSQTFGWGSYFTNDKNIANSYADATTRRSVDNDIMSMAKNSLRSELSFDIFKKVYANSYIKNEYLLSNIKNAISAAVYIRNCIRSGKYGDDFLANLNSISNRGLIPNWIHQQASNINDHAISKGNYGFNSGDGYFNQEFLPFFNELIESLYEVQMFLNILSHENKLSDSQSYKYTVDVPDDNGNNYLDWYEKIDKVALSKIYDYTAYLYNRKMRGQNTPPMIPKDYFINMHQGKTVGEFYSYLANLFKNQKVASLIFSNCGYDGITYPTGTRWAKPQGAMENGRNYVLFRNNNIKIKNKERYDNN